MRDKRQLVGLAALAAVAVTGAVMLLATGTPGADFILGPQVASGSAGWFDQNAIDKGLVHGVNFPVIPPGKQLTGTINLTAGSRTITGNGTRFMSELAAPTNQWNFWIRAADGVIRTHFISQVVSDTQLELSVAWGQSSESWGQPSQSARPVTIATAETFDAYQNQNYYDLALCEYINYQRTGDVRFRDYARKVADSWWLNPLIDEGRTPPELSMAPRVVGFSGLLLRALDGRPEMFPWLTAYARYQYDIWVGQRLTYPNLYYGARDPGYALLHTTNLAAVHPDAAVRDELKQKALAGARDYFARVQKTDGSWRWEGATDTGESMQPFHVGILLEAMIQVHRLTGDTTVRASIIKGAEALYTLGYNPTGWRASYYFVGGKFNDGTDCSRGCGAAANPWPPADANQVAEARQLNATSIHALGYAYELTSDARFKQWGAEMFNSTFSGTDGYRGLAWYREKEYDESYRSGGKFLAWANVAPLPSPSAMPSPSITPTPATSPTPSNPNASPDGTKATMITDSTGAVWTIGPALETLKNGVQAGGGHGSIYKWYSGVVYVLGTDNNWWQWVFNSSWSLYGPLEPGPSQPTPTPSVIPTPTPSPVPVFCAPNALQSTGCICRTQWIGNPKRCKP